MMHMTRNLILCAVGMLAAGVAAAQQPMIVTCESINYRDQECPVPPGPVALVRQLSSPPGDCIEGRTWRYSGNAIWVSNGCRAEFRVGYSGGYRPSPGPGATVVCESIDYRQQECSVPSGPVSIARQLSTPPGDCIEGRTWGSNGQNMIWVSNGCRAEFYVGYSGGHRPRPPPAAVVTCESINYRNQECSVSGGPVTLVRQLSSPPGDCIEGRTWGFNGYNMIWVSNGCRAEFSAGY